MKTLTTPFAAAAWLCCIQISPADTIVLKNGEKIEGHVLREEDGNYIVEVKVSETIRDEKTVAKSDVKYIDKEADDLKAFREIEGFVPTPELLGAAGYEDRIEKIQAFITGYPNSTQVSKAKEMENDLTGELAVVRAGGIKFGEEMVSPGDYMANAYEYDAVIAEKRIREDVGRRDLIGALRNFTKYDQTFAGTAGRGEIVTLVKQVLAAYRASIDESLASLESRIEKRKSGLASMSPEDRAQTERALAEQDERIAARFAKEKAAAQPWVTPDSYNRESLDEARRQVDGETTRLETNSIPVTTPETPVAETYRAAWGKLSGGTEEEKKAVIEDARTKGVPEPYIAKLRERGGIVAP